MNAAHRIAVVAGVSLLGVLALVPAAQAKSPRPSTQYYVSLGDSYAAGIQPSPAGGLVGTREGFAYQVPAFARKRGYRLKVVNFGCAGATTESLLSAVGCPPGMQGPGEAAFNKTQVAAATEFIRANRKNVALVTVSIGGNDFVWNCLMAGDPAGCVDGTLANIRANVGNAARQLRQAAGTKPLIVGTTYPNVLLGAWARPGGAVGQQLARPWQSIFRNQVNPALKSSYAGVKGRFVDVTAATGGYGEMTAMETLAPYGSIPRPVADVCRLTWVCKNSDYHPNKDGYAIIAKMVAAQLPRR